MNEKEPLTQNLIRELFDYNPKTGILLWKERSVNFFEKEDNSRSPEWNQKRWNSRNAGKEALSSVAYYKRKNGDKIPCRKEGRLFGKLVFAHRIIWIWMTGKEPKEIDHYNGDPLDNKWENLFEKNSQK